MPRSDVLQLLFHGNQLKRIIRSGWVQRGIDGAEDVAAHTYGVAFTALLLTKVVPQAFNVEKVLVMALLHDLPEGITTDIPTPAWRLFPAATKEAVEREAMVEILGGTSLEVAFMEPWEELHLKETPESRLVHDADKLEMYLQAYHYERQTGNRRLAEFWANPHRFFFLEAQNVYQELLSLRNEE